MFLRGNKDLFYAPSSEILNYFLKEISKLKGYKALTG